MFQKMVIDSDAIFLIVCHGHNDNTSRDLGLCSLRVIRYFDHLYSVLLTKSDYSYGLFLFSTRVFHSCEIVSSQLLTYSWMVL